MVIIADLSLGDFCIWMFLILCWYRFVFGDWTRKVYGDDPWFIRVVFRFLAAFGGFYLLIMLMDFIYK